MDYHSMKRKELQSLCKKHKIPANMTNLAMADALSALNLVDGVQKNVPESPLNSRNKPQSDLIDNEPRIPVRLTRSRRAPLLQKSVASEEETIVTLPKASAPRICQKKTAGKIVPNAKENNNEKEKEVPAVNIITTRSTRLQQNSEIKISESVLKVDAVEETVPESTVTSRKSLSATRKPQSDLVDNEPRIPVRLARSRRAPLLGSSSASEEIIPKTSAPRTCQKKTEGKVVSKAKGNDNEKEKEVPIVNHITRRSSRFQQNSELKISESVPKVEANKTDMLSEEVNVEEMKSESQVTGDVSQKDDGINGNSSKDEQDDVAYGHVEGVEKTVPESPITIRKSLSARKLQSNFVEKSVASVEEIIPKTSAPSTCQKKTEGKVVSKAKGNNNEKEKEVSVVNHITRQSTRLQQKSKLRVSESVLKVGETNEAKNADMLSEEVNVEEMKSESEVTDDVLQKNGGTTGNSSKEGQDDVVSRNVNSIMVSTEWSMLEKSGDSNATSEDPSSALIMGEISKASTTHVFGECISEDRSAFTLPAEESSLNTADVPNESFLVEGNTEITQVCIESEDQLFLRNEVIEDKGALDLEVKVDNEPAYVMVTEAEALLGDESSPIVEKMENPEDYDAEEGKRQLKCKTGLYDFQLTEVEALSLDAQSMECEDQLIEVEVTEDKGANERTFVMLSEVEALSVEESSPIVGNTENSEDGNCYLDAQSMSCEDQLIEIEVIEAKGANERTYVLLSEVEAPSVDESSPKVKNTENIEDLDVYKVANKLEYETEIYVFNISELEELSSDSDCFYFEAMKDIMEELMNIQEAEDCAFKIQQDCDKSQCINVVADFETSYDEEDDSFVELAISDIEVIEDKGANEHTYVLLSEVEALSVDESSPKVGNTENFEDLDVYKVANKLEYETEIYVFNVSELEELSSDSDCFYFKAMKDMMEELINIQEAEDCTFKIQQDSDKSQCINVAADFETSYDEEDDSFVELAISDIEVIEDKGANEHTYILLSEVEALSVDESSPKVGTTKNFEDSDVYEVANEREYETEIYVFNVSELEELSSDSDCFYFEAMKDMMEESMNIQEAENCTFKIQQDCDESQCINVAADFETSYVEEEDSYVELAISDVVEENEKDNSGDTIVEKGNRSDMDETSNFVATDQIVNQTPMPVATPDRINTSGNQVQQTSRMSSTKKKAATSSRSFIKALDDTKEFDEIGKFSIRITSKVATKVVPEEKENKHENTAQRKPKTKSLGQLRKMMKHLNLADTNNIIVKEQLHVEKRPALRQLSNNNLVHENEN
ncbi:hypothetical protein MKX01_011390 [Papaver californicum]|nr:hypothetical protein MKX01_011390 [Papaver californicum]